MTTENQAKRQKLLQKIAALLAMTEENGCTEAEAMNAAAAADKLMREYDMSYSDLDVEAEVRGDRYGIRRKAFNRSANSTTMHEIAKWCAGSVCRYFNCKVYHDVQTSMICIFGTLEETRMAVDLIALLILALDTEAARYMKSEHRNRDINGRTVRASFAQGFCGRVNQRIKEMREARDAADAGHRTGRSLVVVKSQVVTEEYAKYLRANNMSLSKNRSRGSVGDGGAYVAGQAAGGRVDLGGGKVGGGQLRIGG